MKRKQVKTISMFYHKTNSYLNNYNFKNKIIVWFIQSILGIYQLLLFIKS